MELTVNGSAAGQHTLADVKAFIAACEQLGMPLDATHLSGKTRLTGSGPLKAITATWDERTFSVTGGGLVPGLDDAPTAELSAPVHVAQ